MKASIHWLNRYLDPGNLTPDQAEEILTGASFPIDARDDLPRGDARLEVEVTSNRGDCLSHLGLAREISARTGRRLMIPALPQLPRTDPVGNFITLDNTVPHLCPRFTVQVIRSARIGPSPAWLRDALESVGQRSINNIVDVTNFINFELGHPCHAFDLHKLSRVSADRVPRDSVPSDVQQAASARSADLPSLIIRLARKGETLTTLDGKPRTLAGDEVVVADSERPQSLAGVIGGADSEVTDATTDIVLELATWDPVAVRRAARRHQVRTDASHRFERYVDPRTLDYPAARAAALMIEVAGGQLAQGMLDQGQRPPPAQPPRTINLRPARCRALIGVDIPDSEISRILTALEITVSPAPSPQITATPPPFRPDLTREVDLIEEVARMHGLENIPIHPRMSVEVKHPQESERAIRELARILTGLGFYETVTFSFISREHARAFLPEHLDIITVDDERRKQEPALRPSIIPGLLASRRANQHAGVEASDGEGGIRLFEIASTFAQRSAPSAQHSARSTSPVPGILERRALALLLDIPGIAKGKPGDINQRQIGLRILRGALEALAASLAGAPIDITPAAPTSTAFDAAAFGNINLRGQHIGAIGLIAPAIQKMFDLDIPLAAAEVDIDALIAHYPPRTRIHLLPAFPGIERDLSLIVDESIRWQQLRTLVERANLDRLEELSFIASYRGKQIGPNKKSLTLRLRFRDPARTLRHEEVDQQVATVVNLAARELGAALRA